ncbi:g6183 [Coccomyxa viridis]|uniref:G6183 protein n=1 Tax=Coccomyxa viridis TaxID=1274662 RepID=A0ABP1FXC5_9CHLO
MEASEYFEEAHRTFQPEEHDTCSVRGINQVVLVLQPDESTQYVLLSEERALREAAAKQAALEAAEQGLVPVDPRDAAIMQAIEDGDAAVRRVFQERLHASLHRNSGCPEDPQPLEETCERSKDDLDHRTGEERWLAQLEAADMALTAQLNSRDAALSARI